ncbi:MAG: hypothetical protein V3U76_18780 [Granulosicoccus sp.]
MNTQLTRWAKQVRKPGRNFKRHLQQVSALLILLFAADAVYAEPYLAIRSGQKCMACHINPTGGGKRTKFGRIYGQTVLPATGSSKLLIDDVSDYLDVGADVRSSANMNMIDDASDELAFSTDRATIYFEAKLIPDRLTMYLDQRFAPGTSNREAWLMYRAENKKNFLQAGAFYLPYGIRLEDDTAFIRETTGISFNNADNGIMLGHDNGPWELRGALTNGTNGGAESNTSKQLSMRAAYIKRTWRLGASANRNAGAFDESRNMANVFGGISLFGIEWMGEIDWITDKSPETGQRNQTIGFVEANKEVFKGHNLKGTVEWLDPDFDIAENQQTRTSVVWEYTPIPLMQVRAGVRIRDGIPQNATQNTDNAFVQLHVWF